MKFVRFLHDEEGFGGRGTTPKYGWLDNDAIGVVEGDIFTEFRRMGAKYPIEDVELLPPVSAGKILCVGRNYAAHAEEHGAEVPQVPMIFMKPPNALLGHGGTVLLPPQSVRVEHEAELVIVIGKEGRRIKPEDAEEHIFGYTLGNDITARDLQRRDGQWTRGKGFDTFAPLGPFIHTEYVPSDGIITCHVNGQPRQIASIQDMVFSPEDIIAFVSSFTTLDVGDIIMTGTPAGVGPLAEGDIVEVAMEGLGTLRNRIALEKIE